MSWMPRWWAPGRALQTVASVLLMADPHDLGMVAQVRSPHAERPVIYLWEAVPGGVGLSPRLFERTDELVAGALELVSGVRLRGRLSGLRRARAARVAWTAAPWPRACCASWPAPADASRAALTGDARRVTAELARPRARLRDVEDLDIGPTAPLAPGPAARRHGRWTAVPTARGRDRSLVRTGPSDWPRTSAARLQETSAAAHRRGGAQPAAGGAAGRACAACRIPWTRASRSSSSTRRRPAWAPGPARCPSSSASGAWQGTPS